MKEIITESQKKEIELLAEDHLEALVAYGGDMYRKGLNHGSIWTTVGVFIGAGIMFTAEYVIEHKKSKNKKKINNKNQNEES